MYLLYVLFFNGFIRFAAYSNFIFVGAIIGAILGGIFAAMVVWGALKKRQNFLLPWLIFEVMVIIGTAVCVIICVVLISASVASAIFVLIIGLLELGKSCQEKVFNESIYSQVIFYFFLQGLWSTFGL